MGLGIRKILVSIMYTRATLERRLKRTGLFNVTRKIL